jgi:hypothetical protein
VRKETGRAVQVSKNIDVGVAMYRFEDGTDGEKPFF